MSKAIVYATTSLRGAYRRIKRVQDRRNAGYLLAFGQGDYFMFVLKDAEDIRAALPDVPKYTEVDYPAVRIHATQFFPFAARLKACGFKIAMVSRRVAKDHTVQYSISARSDDGEL